MKKIAKKWLGLALALTVALTVAAPVSAQAAVSVNKEQTIYMTSASGGNTSIYVGGLTKKQTIKKASVKSSNSAVAAPYYLERTQSSYSYETQYFSGSDPYSYSSATYGYYIGLQLKKTGTTTISFKVGNKSYKSKITVKKYTNPLKTVKISGVSNGSNVAGKLKNSNSDHSLKLTKTTKNATVQVAPKKGWKIQSIELSNSESGDTVRVYNYGSKGVSNATLHVGTIKAKSRVTVDITCVDSSGATLYCYYYINDN